MTPAHCRLKHNPPEQYGDCLRAAIATVLDLDTEQVPHFYHDNPASDVALHRVRDFLFAGGDAPFIINYPPDIARDELLEMLGTLNPNATYLLFGNTGNEDHVVVCQGGKVVHNPAWYGGTLVGPSSMGYWMVLVIARI